MQRSEAVTRLDGGTLADYERRRARLGGVAVARLDGTPLRRLPPRPVDGRARRGEGDAGRGSSPTARSAGACWSPRRRRRRGVPLVHRHGVITVWFVFRDPRFDYRLLIVGSVLPRLDGSPAGMRWMHTLVVQPRRCSPS